MVHLAACKTPRTDSAQLVWKPLFPVEPQEVTRRGKPVVVVFSYDEYQRLQTERDEKTPSFRDLLLAIPKGSDDDGFELPERMRDHSERAAEI